MALYWAFSKGLRQGNLFSLYLFAIVMKALSCLLKRAKVKGFLSGWQLRGQGGEGVEVSHLSFINDILVFCESSQDQLPYLSWMLM